MAAAGYENHIHKRSPERLFAILREASADGMAAETLERCEPFFRIGKRDDANARQHLLPHHEASRTQRGDVRDLRLRNSSIATGW